MATVQSKYFMLQELEIRDWELGKLGKFVRRISNSQFLIPVVYIASFSDSTFPIPNYLSPGP